jgi:hypothetical protein
MAKLLQVGEGTWINLDYVREISIINKTDIAVEFAVAERDYRADRHRRYGGCVEDLRSFLRREWERNG